MKQRKIGSQGLAVSELGLGSMGMSAFYGPRDNAESVATLARSLELGVTKAHRRGRAQWSSGRTAPPRGFEVLG